MIPYLKVQGLCKKYGKKVILNNISFELYPSDILGIIGPNGAGKSTLLYILLGIVSPDLGEIYYFGKEFFQNRGEILYKVSFASQYINLPYSLTVEENLKIFAYLYEVSDADIKIDYLLKLFKLYEKKKALTRSLSSGEMMRLNLARAFLNDPTIILLDEPTAGLDPEYLKYVGELFKKFSEEKKLSIILTSHQLGELEKIITKALLVKEGKTLAYGKLFELLEDFKVSSLEELYFKIFA